MPTRSRVESRLHNKKTFQNPERPLRPIFFAVLGALAFLTFFVTGCGMDGDIAGTGCLYDSDCAHEEYCIGAQCVSRCIDDDECPQGTYCQAYQRSDDATPVQACIDADAHDAGGLDCESDDQCRDALDDPDAFCGMHGRCILSADDDPDQQNGEPGNGSGENGMELDPLLLRIEQLDADGSPVSLDDFHPDDDETSPRELHLGALLVRDEYDTAVGFGSVVKLTSSDDTASSELATAPVTLDDSRSCVEDPLYAPYTSLGGPGGQAWIELVDGQYEPIHLQDNWRVQIVADGPECPLGIGEEPLDLDDEQIQWGRYRVSLCQGDGALSIPDDFACEIILGDDLTHFSELEVTIVD